MAFSEELVAELYREQEVAVDALNALLLQTVREAQDQENALPLYIPPASFTVEAGNRYNELDREEYACILAHRWDDLEQVRREKDSLGRAYPVFLHAFSEGADARPIHLHPQLICDVKTILEFGPLFFQHWHERAPS